MVSFTFGLVERSINGREEKKEKRQDVEMIWSVLPLDWWRDQ